MRQWAAMMQATRDFAEEAAQLSARLLEKEEEVKLTSTFLSPSCHK